MRACSPRALVVAGETVLKADGGTALLATVAVGGRELLLAASSRAARPLVHFRIVGWIARLQATSKR